MGKKAAKKARKKRAGRPPLPAGEALTVRFWFRCSQEQMDRLQEAAEAQGQEAGTWLRELGLRAADRIRHGPREKL